MLAPPSLHVSGNHYQWIPGGRGCAPMPTWLVTALQESTGKQAASPNSWRSLVRDGVIDGERNNAVTRLAGHLLRHYVDPHVTLELLIAWNAAAVGHRCRPAKSPPSSTQSPGASWREGNPND